jgi:hypothetical protein
MRSQRQYIQDILSDKKHLRRILSDLEPEE